MQFLIACQIQHLNYAPSPWVIMFLRWEDLSVLMIPSIVPAMNRVACKFNLAGLVKRLSSE